MINDCCSCPPSAVIPHILNPTVARKKWTILWTALQNYVLFSSQIFCQADFWGTHTSSMQLPMKIRYQPHFSWHQTSPMQDDEPTATKSLLQYEYLCHKEVLGTTINKRSLYSHQAIYIIDT